MKEDGLYQLRLSLLSSIFLTMVDHKVATDDKYVSEII